MDGTRTKHDDFKRRVPRSRSKIDICEEGREGVALVGARDLPLAGWKGEERESEKSKIINCLIIEQTRNIHNNKTPRWWLRTRKIAVRRRGGGRKEEERGNEGRERGEGGCLLCVFARPLPDQHARLAGERVGGADSGCLAALACLSR